MPGFSDISWMEYWFILGTLDTGGEVSPNCPGLVPYRTVNVSFLVSSTEVKDHVMVTVLSVELASSIFGRRGAFLTNGVEKLDNILYNIISSYLHHFCIFQQGVSHSHH